jgi:hypothetical protein
MLVSCKGATGAGGGGGNVGVQSLQTSEKWNLKNTDFVDIMI